MHCTTPAREKLTHRFAFAHRFASDNDIPLPHISVDGGVSASNSAALIDAGANVLVAGGSVFKSDDKEAVISDLLYGNSETVTISSGRNDFA